jgi:hypothetical protein
MDVPLERPGPKRRGICLMRESEATKASYLLASSERKLDLGRVLMSVGCTHS